MVSFAARNAKHKFPFPKETVSSSCQSVFFITACSVFWLQFNEVAMEMRSLAGFARRRKRKQTIVSNAKKMLCCECLNAHEVFRDTAFAGHKVTPVKQFQAEDYEALLKRKAFCTEKYHEKEVTRIQLFKSI